MNLIFSSDELRPLIQEIVGEVLEALEASGNRCDKERLAYTESEAAAILGVRSHVLRDARLRDEIEASKVGGRFVYERSELIRYLEKQRQ